MTTINDLPDEVLHMILQNIYFYERKNLTLVCKKWNEVIFTPTRKIHLKLRFKSFDKELIRTFYRMYVNVRISDVCTKEAKLNLESVVSQFSHSLEYFRFERSTGNVFNHLYASLKSMINLKEFVYHVYGSIRDHELDFPHVSSRYSFPNIIVIGFRVDERYNRLTVDTLRTFLELSPNIKQLNFLIFADKLEHDLMSIIKTCSLTLRKLVIRIQDKKFMFALAMIDFPTLEEFELVARIHYCNIVDGINAFTRQFKDRNQIVKLKLNISGHRMITSESIMDSLDFVEDLSIQAKMFPFEKKRKHTMSNLKALEIMNGPFVPIFDKYLKSFFTTTEYPSLESLRINRCYNISDDTMKLIAKRCPNLKNLKICEDSLSRLFSYKKVFSNLERFKEVYEWNNENADFEIESDHGEDYFLSYSDTDQYGGYDSSD